VTRKLFVKAFAIAICSLFLFYESVWLNFPPVKDVGSLYFIVKIIVTV